MSSLFGDHWTTEPAGRGRSVLLRIWLAPDRSRTARGRRGRANQRWGARVSNRDNVPHRNKCRKSGTHIYIRTGETENGRERRAGPFSMERARPAGRASVMQGSWNNTKEGHDNFSVSLSFSLCRILFFFYFFEFFIAFIRSKNSAGQHEHAVMIGKRGWKLRIRLGISCCFSPAAFMRSVKGSRSLLAISASFLRFSWPTGERNVLRSLTRLITECNRGQRVDPLKISFFYTRNLRLILPFSSAVVSLRNAFLLCILLFDRRRCFDWWRAPRTMAIVRDLVVPI